MLIRVARCFQLLDCFLNFGCLLKGHLRLILLQSLCLFSLPHSLVERGFCDVDRTWETIGVAFLVEILSAASEY